MGTTNNKKTTTFKKAWQAARDKWEADSKRFINNDNTYSPNIRTLDSTFKFNGRTYNILKDGDDDAIKNAILSSHALGNYITDKNSGMEKEWGITSENANKVRDQYTSKYVTNKETPKVTEETPKVTEETPKVTEGTPKVTYDRTQTRYWLRNHYINPYSMSGAQRRALRYFLNGDTTGKNYNIDLLKDMNTKYNLGISLNKQGGMLTNKYAQGGSMEDQVMEAFKQWVAQKIQNGEVQESDLKDQNKVKQLFQLFQEEQTKVQSARMGAKLDYINQLNNKCPYGTHLVYYKQGGTVCKRCEADIHNEDKDPIKAFKQKCGGKVSRKELGGEMEEDDPDKKKVPQKSTLVKKSKSPIKKPTTPINTSKKRPGPKDLKSLPNGKYPEYWTGNERGQWDRDHDLGV